MRLGAVAMLLVALCLGLLWALRDRETATTIGTPQSARPFSVTTAMPQPLPDSANRNSPAETTADPLATRVQNIAACRQVLAATRCRDQYFQRRIRGPGSQASPECRDIEAKAPLWRPLYDAALRGHVPSMARFADGTLFNLGKVYAEWDLEAMALYRQHGYDFLVRAANAGDGGAIRKLAREMVTPGRGEGAIPYDRIRGLAYARVLLRHSDPDWNGRLTQETIGSAFRFTAEEWARAEILSHELIPAAAEARLDGWTPNINGPENDFGCAG